jgi:glyoxylate reductase
MKVFITRRIPEVAFKLLRDHMIESDYYKKDKPIPRRDLLRNVKDCNALISLLTDNIDKQMIDAMPNCKVIANFAVGYNNIDTAYAKAKNIIVTNTPNVLTESTADLTIALVLACARRINEGETLVRSGKFKGWKPELLLGVELSGKIFGILGAGRIGNAVAKRIKAFGTKIIYNDKFKNIELENVYYAKKVSLKYLLQGSDILSVHLPLNKNTHHFLGKNELKLLKKTAILINTARGEIIDEKYLIKLLESKGIRAAGLDVYENEHAINPEFFKLKNCVLLPHLGSATEDARNGMATIVAKNVINVLSGKPAITPVL